MHSLRGLVHVRTFGVAVLSLWAALAIFVLSAQNAGAQPRQAAAQSGSSIPASTEGVALSGRVLNSQTGEGVGKAQLQLYSRSGGNGSAPGMYTARSASDGSFLIEGLPAGDYMLMLSRQSFAANAAELRGIPSARPQGNGWTISLRAGQTLRGVEFRMPPAGVITGHVTDEDGEPMTGVAIEAEQYRYVQGVKMLAARGRATSDDRGIYRIYGLAPGRYFVKTLGSSLRSRIGGAFPGLGGGPGGPFRRAGGPGNAAGAATAALGESAVYLETYYPNARSAPESIPLQLTPGAEMGSIDFTLAPSPAYSISGTVSGIEELPVPDGAQRPIVFVGVRPGGQPDFGNVSGLTQANPVTGAFTVRNLAPGNYEVIARSNSRRGGGSAVGVVAVTLGNASVDGVPIPILEDATIPGRVTLPEGYSAVSLARMFITPTRRLNPVRAISRPDSNGAFDITLSRAEAPRLVFGNVPEGLYVKRVLIGGVDIMASSTPTLTSVSGGMKVELAADGASVRGVLSDSRGNPMASARVTAIPASAFEAKDSLAGSVWRRSVMSQDDGSFEMTAMAPGRYRVYAFETLDADPSFDPDFLSNFGQRWTDLNLKPKETTSVEVTPIPANETAMYLGESQ
ncbi:MAG: carboxypeptidase regulatory-like domain-containing protein [Bryobacterales bacterium]|nr:carboxypeptidase regulatory-like domain-containing protein [Bryobacterales bacterium]